MNKITKGIGGLFKENDELVAHVLLTTVPATFGLQVRRFVLEIPLEPVGQGYVFWR